MEVRITAIAPLLNEVDFLGYSVMAAMPFIDEFVYALDEKSEDGTRELLAYLQKTCEKPIVVISHPNFHPSDQQSYNHAFDVCIEKASGDAVMFLHPDQIIRAESKNLLSDGTLAWYVSMKSFARDLKTVITRGRAMQWKNIHRKKFGLTYYGGYGSQNEDFYHRDITGRSYKHYGSEFSKYPYRVADSGLLINHYCEVKDYKRRLEKMKLCLKTLYPTFSEERIHELAIVHPRVTLEDSSTQFGQFEFQESTDPIPDVFMKYKETFDEFRKELIYG